MKLCCLTSFKLTTESEKQLKEYSRLAAIYDQKWSFYIEATTRETLKRVTLTPTDQLLDVGCGSGTLLQRLSERYPKVNLSGIDPVSPMLEIARQRLPERVKLYQGWAQRLPFEAEQFDIIISCNMFHYLQEPVLALREMRRVLRPSGKLVITDWCHDYLTCRLLDGFLRWLNRAHFKTYGKQECVQLLKETDQVVLNVDRYKINWFWGLMTVYSVKDNEMSNPDNT